MSKYWPLIKVLPITTNFRFVAFSRIAAIVSAVAVVVSLGFTLFPFEPPCAGLSCGIDFKGGTLLEISTAPKAVDLGLARSTLEAQNLGDVQVQAFGE
ncbi:MAG: protein translocase subunit SecF, partial [Phenylobacterium sp.]|nr:protein translocase subunit SecF [Phenylobacterium sp.]